MAAPFLNKLYELVSDTFTDDLISWEYTGKCFIIHKPVDFSLMVLPRYFKHSNFSSFIRQLNHYGFHKLHPDEWIFGHENFKWGYRHKLSNIFRKRKSFSTNIIDLCKKKYCHTKTQKHMTTFVGYRYVFAKDILDICKRQEKFLICQKFLESIQKKIEIELNHLKSFIFGYFSRIILHEYKIEIPFNYQCIVRSFSVFNQNNIKLLNNYTTFKLLNM